VQPQAPLQQIIFIPSVETPFSIPPTTPTATTLSPAPIPPTPTPAPVPTRPVVLSSTAQAFNLLDLVGGVSETAAVASVPVGNFDAVRFTIEDAVLTWNDGSGFQLHFPTATASTPGSPTPTAAPAGTPNQVEVRLATPITVTNTAVRRLLLDFDVATTFTPPAGATCESLKTPGAIQFHPNVRLLDLDAVGRAIGVVRGPTGPIAGAVVRAVFLAAGVQQTFAGTLTSGGAPGAPVGQYVLYLPPGTFQLVVEVPGRAAQTAPVTIAAPGEDVVMDFEVP
jgi:hypothetical protein